MRPKEEEEDTLMHIDDLARYMGCSSDAVRKRLKRHPADLPRPFLIGKRLTWRKGTVAAFFERQSRAVQRRKEVIEDAHKGVADLEKRGVGLVNMHES